MGHLDAFLHRHASDGHKRTDIGGPHAGVLTAMLGHVDETVCYFGSIECPVHNRICIADERIHILTHSFHATCLFDSVNALSLAIRNAA